MLRKAAKWYIVLIYKLTGVIDMAKYCAFCGKKLSVFGNNYAITGTEYEYCQEHYELYHNVEMALNEDFEADVTPIVNQFKNTIDKVAPEFEQAVQHVIDQLKTAAMIKEQRRLAEEQNKKIREENLLREEERLRVEIEKQRIKSEENKAFEERVNTLLMTTGSIFDGYTVERYVDVICEEVIFKNGIWKQLSAGLDNLVSAFSAEDIELSSSSELIRNARQYVMKKFKKRVVELGANAVLGVDFENSFGDGVVRVSISGTAVVISKKE